MAANKNTFIAENRRRHRLKMLAVNFVALVGAIALFTLLGFVNHDQKEVVCRKLVIKLPGDESSFFSEENIRECVMRSEPELIGKNVQEINIDSIHSSIMNLGLVKDAHVYVTVDGRCMVELKQRTPIARVLNASGHGYYIDAEGFTVPLSSHHTSRVPVFTGKFFDGMQEKSIIELETDSSWSEKSVLDDIYEVTRYIMKNKFLRAQVEHVYINEQKKMEIIPRVGNHLIVIGDSKNLDIKFKKLMAFYASTVHKADINQYSKINLEFEGQVVCVKR